MDFISLFKKYLDLIPLDIKEEQIQQFYLFYNILKEKNKEINFTRLHSLEDIIKKHFVDSLIIQKILKEHKFFLPNPLMDLGTGGGFPGIPLAIINPKIKFILVESRKNRIDYLQEVKDILQVKNVEIIHKTLNYKDEVLCKGVITRAIESIKDTAIRTANSLEKEGLLIFLKGPNCDKEIEEMNYKFFELVLDHHYTLPDVTNNQVDYRRLVIFRKKISRDILLQQQNRYYFKLSEYVLIKNISSFENSYYKNLKKLENSREIKKQNKALIAGKKIINDYIQNKVKNILSIIFTKNVSEDELFKYYETLIRKEKDLKVDYVYIQSELLQSLELNQYPPPYLEVKVNPIKSVEDFSFKDSFIVLPLQDPVNMGACIRSAYAFGINNILLTKESCNPYLLKAVRSSAGTVFNCNFYELSYQYPSDILEKSKIPIYVLDLKGKDIRTIKKIPQTFGLILGEEGKGIPENLIPKNAEKIFIPINPSLDSLNVSVACGIALFYLSKNN